MCCKTSYPSARAVEHHPAMPWRDVQAFMAELKGREPVSARALEWTILTGGRTSDTLGAPSTG